MLCIPFVLYVELTKRNMTWIKYNFGFQIIGSRVSVKDNL